MSFKEVKPEELTMNPFTKIGKEWLLITAGNEEKCNTMTASWGAMGVMWGKNVAIAVIRPQRYTKKFVDEQESFTLSFYPDDKKPALSYCGSHSGKDMAKGEKAAAAGLTPLYVDGTVAYEEADMILVCKKLYEAPVDPKGFADESLIAKWYPDSDFHEAYVAEITAVYTK